jgi:hypothetical protein
MFGLRNWRAFGANPKIQKAKLQTISPARWAAGVFGIWTLGVWDLRAEGA